MDFIYTFFLILGIALAIGLFVFFLRKSKVDEKQTDSIRDLERRLTDLMIGQLKEIRDTQNGASKEMHNQIRSFTQETTQIREDLKGVQETIKDVSSFQDIFKSPKLRGQWGEASLEHILSQHFPKELYTIQYLFPSGEQVDAALKLPNGRVLPIDSKFPSENFDKMVNAVSETEKSFFKKSFLEDVKKRVQEIASKYVLPSEGTVDFALMYVPAEAVYYEIINSLGKEIDIAAYAWSKKIILTSPNTIYLTLRTIEHWFKDTQVSRKTQDILKRMGKVHQDASKLMDEFRKLGGHIRNASSAYENSEKRLSLLDERVEKLVQIGETKQLKEPDK
ncbi:MAG TPA: DNA recombination protein RmuC [Candidatus Paceibacterota bacterium]|nr:DNA recombination protein RmuC [Candidatus Paceibacterota bacterium]